MSTSLSSLCFSGIQVCRHPLGCAMKGKVEQVTHVKCNGPASIVSESLAHIPESIRSRRSVMSSFVLLHTALSWTVETDQKYSDLTKSNLERLANRIRSECPRMVQAAKSTGRFLYRGGTGKSIEFVLASPDLLIDGTYPKQGTLFFQSLDKFLRNRGARARPSTGHIAVSDVAEAGIWGLPKSCWPVGDFNYVWFKRARLLYADGICNESVPTCMDGLGIEVDSNIEEAMQRGHEVLFSAPSFLLIPASADAQFRALLGLPAVTPL